MKKITMPLLVLLASILAGGHLMAQPGDKRVPVRTTDPHPFSRPAAVRMPVKSGAADKLTLPAGQPAGSGGAATRGPVPAILPPVKTTAVGSGTKH